LSDPASATSITGAVPERILAVHFPKASGSSLQVQFVQCLGDRVLVDYSHDPMTEAGQEAASFPADKQMVFGHFSPRRYATTDAFRLTFLRHPVDNLISIYYYWRSLPEPGNPTHARFLRELPSIFEFALYPGIQRLMSETYFGGVDMRRFDFIGFYENRAADIARLSACIGLKLTSSVHTNRTLHSAERVALENDYQAQSRLAGLLRDDLGFYDRERKKVSASF
jgi:hypothetical protein